MTNHIELDVRELYCIARQSLEKVADGECEQVEGLFRCIAALGRLIELGRETIGISTGCWNRIAPLIEFEADRERARGGACGQSRTQKFAYYTRHHNRSPIKNFGEAMLRSSAH